MNEEVLSRIKSALLRSWSAKTSLCYSEDAPVSYGQCTPTVIVIWERLGGEILKTDGWSPNGRHFNNRIDGVRYNFTANQFADQKYLLEINSKDLQSSFEEDKTETLSGQIEAMGTAFDKAFAECDGGAINSSLPPLS